MVIKMRQEQRELLTRECGISRCSENWVDVLYRYADGSPVPQANYLIADASSSFKKSGTLDDAGSAHVSLPDNVLEVTVTFSNDPEEIVLLRKPEAHGEVVEQGWFDNLINGITSSGRAVWDALKGAVVWVWEVAQGDFNEDATVAQIITGTVITLVPVVDQVADVRDIVANLKKLIWDKRYGEVGVWAALVLTLVGTIPELGSLLKGACKSIYRGAKLGEVFKVINGLSHTNAKKWLKKLLEEIPTHSATVTKMLLGILDEIQVKLAKILDKLPTALTSFRKKISEVLVTLAEVRAQAARRVKEVFDDVTEKLRRLLGEKEPAKTGGGTRQEHLVQQKATPPEGLLGAQQPVVQNAKLKNLMDNIYKGAKNPKRVGDGSLGDAIRNEISTGQLTHGTGHIQKGRETVNGLQNWLKKNPGASASDVAAAQQELQNLLNALGSAKP